MDVGWRRFLIRGRIGRNAQEVEGILLRHDILEASVARSYTRCGVCGRIEANGTANSGCARPRCAGRMLPYCGPVADGNLNARLIAAAYAPTLIPGEHSAAVTEEERLKAEEGFKQSPPRPNVLVCTPTLELGVNIGDLEGVAMRNVPPSPANYAQRAGRTGRETRTGIIAGFARGTPHDGYFFDHPGEVISGAIPPPRFNLDNLAAIERHVNSLVLEEAALEYANTVAGAGLRDIKLERAAVDTGAVDAGMRLPRLMFTRAEAESIQKLAARGSSMKAVDFQANLATATSAELGKYRIVHFATHGLLNTEHPALSGLVFSLVNEKGEAQNGFLSLPQVYNLKLGADLVVLSACQTALGKEIRGEGLTGLVRGFMYAGAPRVVASLWKVDDVATSLLMERFYRGMLVEKQRPAAALRAAQVSMWKQSRWSSPYYWAAFVMQGEWK